MADCLDELARVRDNLDLADRGKLARAIKETVARVEIGNDHPHRIWSGTVHLRPDVAAETEIPTAHGDLFPDHLWWDAVQYIRRTDRVVGIHELRERYPGVDHSQVLGYARRGVTKGLLTRETCNVTGCCAWRCA